jgi:exodeoxyribonuclease VII large subunit
MAKVEALVYGDRKVYSVAAFNRGVAGYVARLPEVWIEGEVTELRRNARWARVFFTLKDPTTGACLPASIDRGRFDRLELGLVDGERVHVLGRAAVY